MDCTAHANIRRSGKLQRGRIECQPAWQRIAISERRRHGCAVQIIGAECKFTCLGSADFKACQHARTHRLAISKIGVIGSVEGEAMNRAATARILEHHMDRNALTLRHSTAEAHARGIEGEPVGQIFAIGLLGNHGKIGREIAGGKRAQHACTAEEKNIALGLDVIAKSFCRDDEQRPVLKPGYQIIAQNGAIIVWQDIDRNISSVGPALAIADRVAEPCITVKIGPRLEDDLAIGIEADLAIGGKTLDPGKDQRVAIGVAVIGKQCRRIDDYRLVLEDCETIIIRIGRIIGRQDLDLVGQRGTRAARIDDIEGDSGEAFGVRRERYAAAGGIEYGGTVSRGIAIERFVKADKADSVAFDVVHSGHEVGDGEGRRPPEADIFLNIVRAARRVVNRLEVKLNRCDRARTRWIFEDIVEACKAVKIGTRVNFEKAVIDASRKVGTFLPGIVELERIDLVAIQIAQRRYADNTQIVPIIVDIIIVRLKDRIEAYPQYLVFKCG